MLDSKIVLAGMVKNHSVNLFGLSFENASDLVGNVTLLKRVASSQFNCKTRKAGHAYILQAFPLLKQNELDFLASFLCGSTCNYKMIFSK